MQFQLPIDIKPLQQPISYEDKILLTGSCFTEHIGHGLADVKFNVLQNPHGILFGADAVCKSLKNYIANKQYTANDLFLLNEVWNSWEHHSRFSNINKEVALQLINRSQQEAHLFLKDAHWLIITLGSSFTYLLSENAIAAGNSADVEKGSSVANCHRAPANWFNKQMLETESIKAILIDCINELNDFNPRLKIIFTVSPVRHIRDGVVENNRSKARLIEAVHSVIDKYDFAYYFPAYELVIDVLRDYRFYDVDMVHPNYPATEFVLEKFTESCIDPDAQLLMKEVKKIVIARRHKPFHPDTVMHKHFLVSNYNKIQQLLVTHPYLNFQEELAYFNE